MARQFNVQTIKLSLYCPSTGIAVHFVTHQCNYFIVNKICFKNGEHLKNATEFTDHCT